MFNVSNVVLNVLFSKQFERKTFSIELTHITQTKTLTVHYFSIVVHL